MASPHVYASLSKSSYFAPYYFTLPVINSLFFLQVLAIFSNVGLLPTSLLSLISVVLGASAQEACPSHSLPNPIASKYPQNITGTLNGTIAMLPIPMALARSMIPSQYNILTTAYRTLLPHLPEDMYPAILQAVFDHDVGLGDYKIADFSVLPHYSFAIPNRQ